MLFAIARPSHMHLQSNCKWWCSSANLSSDQKAPELSARQNHMLRSRHCSTRWWPSWMDIIVHPLMLFVINSEGMSCRVQNLKSTRCPKSIKKVQAGYLSMSKLQQAVSDCLSLQSFCHGSSPFEAREEVGLSAPTVGLCSATNKINDIQWVCRKLCCGSRDSVIYPIYPGLYVWRV